MVVQTVLTAVIHSWLVFEKYFRAQSFMKIFRLLRRDHPQGPGGREARRVVGMMVMEYRRSSRAYGFWYIGWKLLLQICVCIVGQCTKHVVWTPSVKKQPQAEVVDQNRNPAAVSSAH